MEPKYNALDWVLSESKKGNQFVGQIRKPMMVNDTAPAYYTYRSGEIIFESDILYAVRIIPIVDKPKCKDCQNFNAFSYNNDCSMDKWLLENYSDRLPSQRVAIDQREPPDGSTCFRPKVGHEQKESK